MLRRDSTHDSQPVAMAIATAETRTHPGSSPAPQGEDLPLIENREAEETTLFQDFDADLATAVLECVADQVVQRLTKLDPVAEQERVATSPGQTQRAARDLCTSLPSLQGFLDHRPQGNRSARTWRSSPVDFTIEAIDRSSSHPQRGVENARGLGVRRKGERQHLEWSPKLVHRLV
jgi:hypothetical protein